MLPVRTLCLFGFTAGLTLSGCVGSHHDPGPGPGAAAGNFAAAWDLAWIGSSGLITCEEAGAQWVDLDLLDRYNKQYHDRFSCSAYSGTSQTLYAGDYSVVLRVRDASERLLSATDPYWFTIVNGTTYLADSAGNPPVMDLQSFYLDWTVSRGGLTTSCDRVGAKWVEVTSQLSTESQPASVLLPCASYAGNTPAIPVGNYTVGVQLLDAGENPLLDERGSWTQTMTVDGTRRADLGTIDFHVL